MILSGSLELLRQMMFIIFVTTISTSTCILIVTTDVTLIHRVRISVIFWAEGG